jgi:hypothetical protein
MGVVLWVLAILIGVPLFLALVPVRYRVAVTVGSGTSVNATASYLLHLIHITINYTDSGLDTSLRIAGFRLKARPAVAGADSLRAQEQSKPKRKLSAKQKAKAAPAPPEKKSIKERFDDIKAVLTHKDLKIIIDILFKYVKMTFRYLIPKRFTVTGTVGLNDPYKTGLLIGGVYGLAGALNKEQHIRVSGDFNNPALRLEVYASGRVSMVGISAPFIWMVTRKPVFRLLKEHFQSRQKNR